eukprot:m51a1_g1324 hypothetical protein (743) ;mRNA; f:259312-262772
MKFVLSAVVVAVVAVSLIDTSAADDAKPLSITILDMGQADSQLIVFPSGFTILIDAGEEGPMTHAGAAKVADFIKQKTGGTHVDVGLLTHLHCDHLGQFRSGGFWYLLEKAGITFGKFIDRDHGVWVDKDGDGVCPGSSKVPFSEIEWHNMGSSISSTTGPYWVCYATNPNSKIYKAREIAKLCSATQIAPPDEGARVVVVSVDAAGVKEKDGSPLAGDRTSEKKPPYENDYSVGLMIRYKGFTYGTFGDLDGEYYEVSNMIYHDIETTALNRVGPVDLYHVNHHGSSKSSNSAFVSKLAPTVSVISCGFNNSYHHPTEAALQRLAEVGSAVYMTEAGRGEGIDYKGAAVAGGAITISVDGKTGNSFTVTTPLTGSKTFTSKKTATLPLCDGKVVDKADPPLSITILDMGQADSQLIVFPSGFTILIDAGELGPMTHAGAAKVADFIKQKTGGTHVDVGLLTHLHCDHLGQFRSGGFWYLLERAGITFGKFIDRDHGVWVDKDGDGVCPGSSKVPFSEIEWHNMGSSISSTTGPYWIYKAREIAKLCSATQIVPPDDGARVVVVSVDAINVTGADGRPVGGDHTTDSKPPYENDYSVGLMIRFKGFTYGTFGDLDGSYNEASNMIYHDIETSALNRVGPVDLYHVDHHGSSLSSNSAFVSKLAPTVSVISCGLNNSYYHPSDKTLQRLIDVGSAVYMTEAGRGKTYSTKMTATLPLCDGKVVDTAQPFSGRPQQYSIARQFD